MSFQLTPFSGVELYSLLHCHLYILAMLIVVILFSPTHVFVSSQHFLAPSFFCPSNDAYVIKYPILHFDFYCNTFVLTGALLDHALANYRVDENRMYIGGFSSGSLNSWAIAKGEGYGRLCRSCWNLEWEVSRRFKRLSRSVSFLMLARR